MFGSTTLPGFEKKRMWTKRQKGDRDERQGQWVSWQRDGGWMVSPVALQAFLAASLTVCTWGIATLPVSAAADRGRETKHNTEKDDRAVSKLNADWRAGCDAKGPQAEVLLCFGFFVACESSAVENLRIFPPGITTLKAERRHSAGRAGAAEWKVRGIFSAPGHKYL